MRSPDHQAAPRRKRRDHGLEIVVVPCYRTGWHVIGDQETPSEFFDNLWRRPAMPRQRLEADVRHVDVGKHSISQ